MRLIERMPEATPALVWSTAFMAAVLIGDITRAMPRPIRTKRGEQEAVARVDVEMSDCQNSEPDDEEQAGDHQRARADAVGQPAGDGPMKMITIVEGRKRTPASSGE